jgi:TetR/AcrR family transcriptional regulator, tetracycline repressor protein
VNARRLDHRSPRGYGELDRRTIVEGALRIVRRSGVEALSMRALAAELGVSHATPYYYVESKQALLGLLVDEVVGSVVVPPPGAGSWQERLRMLEASARSEFAKYPGLRAVIRQGAGTVTGADAVDVDVRLTEAPVTPNSVRLAEAVVQILREAGFDDEGSLYAFAAIYTYMMGQFETDDTLRPRRGPRRPADWGPGMLVPQARGLRPDDVFDFGLSALLRGLEEHIHPQEPSDT